LPGKKGYFSKLLYSLDWLKEKKNSDFDSDKLRKDVFEIRNSIVQNDKLKANGVRLKRT
jgi:hypothetical protein